MKLNCEYIKSLRKDSVGKYEKKMNRTELSAILDLDARTIYRMESEENFNPTVFTLSKFAKHFNVSIDSLLID